MKTCTKCKKTLPLDLFYRNRSAPDGRHSQCAECMKANTRRYMKQHREERRQYQRQYAAKFPERIEESNRKWRERHPDRHQQAHRADREIHVMEVVARRAVKAAKANGTLVPQSCERCGSTTRIEAHHEDYSKPLDVNWLCSGCHGDRHKEINQAARRNTKEVAA